MPTAAHPALGALSATRREIVDLLKKKGELSAGDLAKLSGLTVSAIRQQLTSLQRDGLVTYLEQRNSKETRGQLKPASPEPSKTKPANTKPAKTKPAKTKPGRPRHSYRLTAAADGLYPRTYAELTNELLDYIGDARPELVDEIFQRRRERRIEGARSRLSGKSFKDQVTELTKILDQDGYLAEVIEQGDGSFLVVEHNCAILGIALRYGQACGTEIDFIRAVLPNATVERISHMVQGAHNCSYVISPKGRR